MRVSLGAAMSAPWPPWSLEASSWLAGLLRGSRYAAAAYYESQRGHGRLLLEQPLPPGLLPRHDFMAGVASGGGGVCSFSGYTLPSGSHAFIAACVERPLQRQGLLTASPPAPQRRLPAAVLEAYIRRLLGDGVSLWRLAALLASTAGAGAVALLVLVEKPGRPPAPLLYLSASGSRGLCVKHLGGLVSAWVVERPGPGCPGGRALHARPRGGTVMMEVKTLREALET